MGRLSTTECTYLPTYLSPSLRKHGLVSAQGPSSDCQFPGQVFVVKNA